MYAGVFPGTVEGIIPSHHVGMIQNGAGGRGTSFPHPLSISPETFQATSLEEPHEDKINKLLHAGRLLSDHAVTHPSQQPIDHIIRLVTSAYSRLSCFFFYVATGRIVEDAESKYPLIEQDVENTAAAIDDVLRDSTMSSKDMIPSKSQLSAEAKVFSAPPEFVSLHGGSKNQSAHTTAQIHRFSMVYTFLQDVDTIHRNEAALFVSRPGQEQSLEPPEIIKVILPVLDRLTRDPKNTIQSFLPSPSLIIPSSMPLLHRNNAHDTMTGTTLTTTMTMADRMPHLVSCSSNLIQRLQDLFKLFVAVTKDVSDIRRGFTDMVISQFTHHQIQLLEEFRQNAKAQQDLVSTQQELYKSAHFNSRLNRHHFYHIANSYHRELLAYQYAAIGLIEFFDNHSSDVKEFTYSYGQQRPLPPRPAHQHGPFGVTEHVDLRPQLYERLQIHPVVRVIEEYDQVFITQHDTDYSWMESTERIFRDPGSNLSIFSAPLIRINKQIEKWNATKHSISELMKLFNEWRRLAMPLICVLAYTRLYLLELGKHHDIRGLAKKNQREELEGRLAAMRREFKSSSYMMMNTVPSLEFAHDMGRRTTAATAATPATAAITTPASVIPPIHLEVEEKIARLIEPLDKVLSECDEWEREATSLQLFVKKALIRSPNPGDLLGFSEEEKKHQQAKVHQKSLYVAEIRGIRDKYSKRIQDICNDHCLRFDRFMNHMTMERVTNEIARRKTFEHRWLESLGELRVLEGHIANLYHESVKDKHMGAEAQQITALLRHIIGDYQHRMDQMDRCFALADSKRLLKHSWDILDEIRKVAGPGLLDIARAVSHEDAARRKALPAAPSMTTTLTSLR